MTRHARPQQIRRIVVVVAVLAVALLGASGADKIADIADERRAETVEVGGRDLVPVPTTDVAADGDLTCEQLRIAGPAPTGFSQSLAADGTFQEPVDPPARSVEVRHVRTPTITGERSGPAGWEITTGVHDGEPAVELEIGWFPPCRLLLIGHGVPADDLAALAGGYHLLAPDDRRPLLDPRGAVWPETAQTSVPFDLSEERRSPVATAYAFAGAMLRWDDVIEEDDPEVDHAGGACDLVVFVRRASDPEGRYPIHLSLAVGRRWWSVCRVDFGFPGDRPAAHVSISGSTAFAATDVEPPGTVSADASFRYASGERIASLGEHVDLGFVPDSSGSVVIRFLNAAGEAVAAWAVALPAGDVRIGNPTDPVLTSGPMPVVVGRNGVLGWWDGGRWRDADVQRAEDLPYEPGDEFAVAGVDGTASTAIAGEPTGHEYCGSASVDNRVAFRPTLDPPIPNEFDALEPRVAVRAGWDISPRSPGTLDVASAAYVEVVADVLRGRGIEDVPVVLRQALRVDLDGNGTEEVLLAAEHPDAHPGGGPLAGWYSVVLLRQLVEDEVVTTPLLLTTFTSDNPHNYPTHATHRLTAVADLNGDGTMEIVTDTRYFESSATEVFELQTDGAGARRVLSAGCGV